MSDPTAVLADRIRYSLGWPTIAVVADTVREADNVRRALYSRWGIVATAHGMNSSRMHGHRYDAIYVLPPRRVDWRKREMMMRDLRAALSDPDGEIIQLWDNE